MVEQKYYTAKAISPETMTTKLNVANLRSTELDIWYFEMFNENNFGFYA